MSFHNNNLYCFKIYFYKSYLLVLFLCKTFNIVVMQLNKKKKKNEIL